MRGIRWGGSGAAAPAHLCAGAAWAWIRHRRYTQRSPCVIGSSSYSSSPCRPPRAPNNTPARVTDKPHTQNSRVSMAISKTSRNMPNGQRKCHSRPAARFAHAGRGAMVAFLGRLVGYGGRRAADPVKWRATYRNGGVSNRLMPRHARHRAPKTPRPVAVATGQETLLGHKTTCARHTTTL